MLLLNRDKVNEYKRLSPLTVEDEAISNLKNVRKGDCVVGFSRRSIFQLKQEIERRTNNVCATIYGSLPPEVRSEQARLFNEGQVYDVMVATDAIGMGLNLYVFTSIELIQLYRNVRRIVFDTVKKMSAPLPAPLVKQIAGRAGRFGKNYAKAGGFVTTFVLCCIILFNSHSVSIRKSCHT